MNYKNKLILATLLISLLSTKSFATVKYDSELVVSGSDVWERVDGALTTDNNDGTKDNNGNHELNDGEKSVRAALWAEDGATIHNIGTISSHKHKYTTQMVSILGIGAINNALKKEDNLVVLKNGSILYNDGKIELGGVDQKVEVILTVADLAFYRKYSDYTKNLINMEYSTLGNTGIIKEMGDHFSFLNAVSVDLLKYNEANFNKNVVYSKNSSIKNTGKIIYDRDYSVKLTDYVGVDLLQLGIHYNRDVHAINDSGSTIINDGQIFVGGDLFQEQNYGGVGASVIGVDLVGTHNKYGIKSYGGNITNTGSIEIERDYTYGVKDDNTILYLELLYSGILDLGLLSFDTYSERSIGVSIDGGVFTNENGRIKVGTNYKKNILEISDNAAIGIEAKNGSTVNFNGGLIELEGAQVWVASLTGGSNMFFRGDSTIHFQTEKAKKETINTDIFGNDGTGRYTIEGNLKVDGKTIEIKKEDGSIYQESKQFNTDLTLGKNSNVYIGIETLEKIDEEGNKYSELSEDLGKIEVSGKLDIKGSLGFDASKLVGITDYSKYYGDVIVSTGGGITGNTTINSSTPIFSFSTSTDGKQIVMDKITRNSFNDIIDNKELGEIFESNYDTATIGQLDVYKYLAGGIGEKGFERRITEVTGRDTLTTLNSQVYDITKDLNKQFKDFAKTNREDGVVFKYINSKSELGANSSTIGFDRKSSGIMVGYNNSISEKLRLGAGFSYMKSDIDYTSASSNDITTWNFRGYSDYDLGYANLFNDLSFGYNQSENKRLSEGVDSTGLKEGDLDVYSLSLNNSLYKNYQLNNKLSLSTSLNLDFTYLYQEDYKENGAMAASSDSADAFYITAGVGVDGKYNLASFGNSKINLVAGMEYAYDVVSDTEKTKIKMKDFAHEGFYHEETRELDKKSLTYDIGVNYEYNDRYSLGLKYSKELINDIDNDQIGVDIAYKF
jgi:hypothetical protein